jgi:very-short-patch-repair endonuclease
MRELAQSDAELVALAARQYGVVATWQLEMDAKAIARRVASGRLFRLHRGVYAVGHPGVGREGRWMAAVLACGPGAVLSHRSAAVLWGLPLGELFRPEVTTAEVRRHAGVTSHQGSLAEADRTVLRGIPVTTVPRMLADLAHTLDADPFDRLVREVQYLGLWDRGAIEDALTRRPSRRLRAHLPALVTQRELERRFLVLCRRHRIPAPERQHRIDGKAYDFAWPDQRVVAETDGWQAHGTPRGFQADRTETNALQLAGWLVLRFTWEDVTRRPGRVAAAIRSALSRPT